MKKVNIDKRKGANYTAFESGSLNDWINKSVTLPGLGKIDGKLFVKDFINSTGCEMSINAMQPDTSMPIIHTHKENEEIYFFLHGNGQMQIDDETFDVSEGSIVRISPQAQRTWRNIGKDIMIFIILQIREDSLRQYSGADGVVLDKSITWPLTRAS